MSTSYAEAMAQLRDYDELERKYEHCLRLIDAYERERSEAKQIIKKLNEILGGIPNAEN